MKKILLVCTANICRSPAAQVILAKQLEGASVIVDSAGTMALNGNSADKTIRRLVSSRGYASLDSHQSKPTLPHLLRGSDLILCMENQHIQDVIAVDPVLIGKTMLLGHWSNRLEVDDPIGLSEEKYDTCIRQIEDLTKIWADKIFKLGLLA